MVQEAGAAGGFEATSEASDAPYSTALHPGRAQAERGRRRQVLHQVQPLPGRVLSQPHQGAEKVTESGGLVAQGLAVRAAPARVRSARAASASQDARAPGPRAASASEDTADRQDDLAARRVERDTEVVVRRTARGGSRGRTDTLPEAARTPGRSKSRTENVPPNVQVQGVARE